jgi:hypothetical protein
MANRFFSYAVGVKGSLSPFAKTVLMDLMNECGIDWLQITSVERTPEDQARVMYENIEKKGAASQHELYGYYGDLVINAYETYTLMQYSKEAVIQLMARKIREIGAAKVSHHCNDDPSISVFDIGPHSLRSDAGIKSDELRKAFETAVRADARVVKFLSPSNSDPAFHLEVREAATA